MPTCPMTQRCLQDSPFRGSIRVQMTVNTEDCFRTPVCRNVCLHARIVAVECGGLTVGNNPLIVPDKALQSQAACHRVA